MKSEHRTIKPLEKVRTSLRKLQFPLPLCTRRFPLIIRVSVKISWSIAKPSASTVNGSIEARDGQRRRVRNIHEEHQFQGCFLGLSSVPCCPSKLGPSLTQGLT